MNQKDGEREPPQESTSLGVRDPLSEQDTAVSRKMNTGTCLLGWATQRRQVIKRDSSGATRAKADWRRWKKNGRKEVASRVNSFEDVSW